MKKAFVLIMGISIILVFGDSQVALAVEEEPTLPVLECIPGHESTGIQHMGGAKGRWQLWCDESTTAICCIS